MLFGVDNNLLSRALDEDFFEPYESPELDDRRPAPTSSTRGTADADRPRRGLPQLRQRSGSRARDRRRRRLDELLEPALPRPARRREPGHVHTRPRVPARHDRRATARTAGRSTGAAARQRRARRRRLEEAYTALLLRPAAARGSGRSSSRTRRARPPRSSSRSRSEQAPTAVVEPTASARSSSPASCAGAERGGRAQARSTSCSPRGSRPTCRSGCSSSRCARDAAARRRSRASRSCPTSRSTCRPRRSARTATAGSRSGRHRAALSAQLARGHVAVPAAFLALFFAYPARGDPRARPPGEGDALLDVSRAADTRDRLVHGLAGGCLDGADARRRAPARLGVGRFDSVAARVVRALVVVPFVLPTVVVATAFLALLPDGTSAGSRRSSPRTSSSTSPSSSASSAASGHGSTRGSGRPPPTLGASPLARVAQGHAPAARAGARRRGGARLPLLLHLVRRRPRPRRPGHATLETEIYNQAARLFDLRAAAALSLVQLVAWSLSCSRSRRGSSGGSPVAAARRRERTLAGPRGAASGRRRRVPRRARLVLGCRSPCSSSARSRRRRLRPRLLPRRSATRRPPCSSRPGTRS